MGSCFFFAEKGEINDFQVDLNAKSVSVVSTKPLEDVQAIVEKSGKKTTFVKST
jgi:hypothetical protein